MSGGLLQHLKDHLSLGVPTTDPAGNILAHVTPRSDTLSGLLATAVAGDGEVSSASDIDAQVMFRGNPADGVEYLRPVTLATAKFTSTGLIIAAGQVDTPQTITTVNLDERGYIDEVSDVFNTPTLTHPTETAQGCTLDIDMNILSALPAVAGTYVRARLQQLIVSTWTDITGGNILVPIVPLTGTNATYRLQAKLTAPPTTNNLRFVFTTDDTQVIPADITTIIHFNNYAGSGYTAT